MTIYEFIKTLSLDEMVERANDNGLCPVPLSVNSDCLNMRDCGLCWKKFLETELESEVNEE